MTESDNKVAPQGVVTLDKAPITVVAGVIQDTAMANRGDSVVDNPMSAKTQQAFEGGDPNEPLHEKPAILGL